jgi:hypothetical protein
VESSEPYALTTCEWPTQDECSIAKVPLARVFCACDWTAYYAWQSLPVCLCSCNMSDRFAKHDCRISHGSTFGLEVQLELSARLSGDRVHFRAMSDEACARQGRIAFV